MNTAAEKPAIQAVEQPGPSPIAEAIRLELAAILTEGDPALSMFACAARTAHHGRLLVAVRNPMTRFDARAMSDEGAPVPPPGAYGEAEDCEDDGYVGAVGYDAPYVGAPSSWNRGSMARFRREQEEQLRKKVATSPVAQALRAELVELVSDAAGFTPTRILEVEQLAARGISVLEARLGLPSSARRLGGRGFCQVGGAMYTSSPGPWAPSTSTETFGAAAIRALGSRGPSPSDKVEIVKAIAAAKEEGLDDVVADLKRQLTGGGAPALQEPDGKEAS